MLNVVSLFLGGCMDRIFIFGRIIYRGAITSVYSHKLAVLYCKDIAQICGCPATKNSNSGGRVW